jgi:hypothetical protein
MRRAGSGSLAHEPHIRVAKLQLHERRRVDDKGYLQQDAVTKAENPTVTQQRNGNGDAVPCSDSPNWNGGLSGRNRL